MKSSNRSGSTRTQQQVRGQQLQQPPQQEPPIWATRVVEWPLATKLPVAVYSKLSKASRAAGQQLFGNSTAAAAATAAVTKQPQKQPQLASSSTTPSPPVATGSTTTITSSESAATAVTPGDDGKIDDGTASTTIQNNSNYFAGFMSRVLSNAAAAGSTTATHATTSADYDEASEMDLTAATTTTTFLLRAPRPGCVAAANGWIVAAVECHTTSPKHPASPSPLRLVSRWNVRRGVNLADQWMALPPPVVTTTHHPTEDVRIVHVFVDPTGSHTLLSAANGEAYYLHSNSSSPTKTATKLPGFGMGTSTTTTTDGTKLLTGVAATAVAHKLKGNAAIASTIQQGLSAHSYVTAVAWDKERGTEGSSKSILLGTSAGEIYEYCLVSPTAAADDGVPQPAALLPVLLHKLYSHHRPTDALSGGDPSEAGAIVTGLYFERLRTGLLVLAATSGKHKRTRLYTFYSHASSSSSGSSSFRTVLADQQHASLQELPGSVDFADLRLCNDHFAFLTQTGIYYGTMDRSLAGPAVMSGGSSMLVDSGLLPYDVIGSKAVPVSLALTPHHIVLLTENNEILFINRVAQKVVQRERVDYYSTAAGGAGANMDESAVTGSVGEFLMDIRRPDQIWLRRNRSLVHISSSQEDRDVWKFTLQKCLEMPVVEKPLLSSPPLRFGGLLTEEEKAQEALFEQAKTLCTNTSQKVREV